MLHFERTITARFGSEAPPGAVGDALDDCHVQWLCKPVFSHDRGGLGGRAGYP
ncbi:unnamed protein product [Scytosiphon promiscuus]